MATKAFGWFFRWRFFYLQTDFISLHQKPIRVETCNARAQSLNNYFAKYHIWKHEEFVRECFIHVMTVRATFFLVLW